jgi:hypothetical protein
VGRTQMWQGGATAWPGQSGENREVGDDIEGIMILWGWTRVVQLTRRTQERDPPRVDKHFPKKKNYFSGTISLNRLSPAVNPRLASPLVLSRMIGGGACLLGKLKDLRPLLPMFGDGPLRRWLSWLRPVPRLRSLRPS